MPQQSRNNKRAKEALRQSEDQFQLLVDGVRDYAIFMLDTGGHIISWNQGAQLIKGYSADEVIGRHFSLFYTDEDLQDRKPERELQIAIATGHFEEEGWRLRKDGTRFWANVLITALYDETSQLRGFGKVTRDMTERKQAEEERERLREQARLLAIEQATRAKIEEALRMREEFLALAAHELRTPVTSLLGFSQLLQRRFQRGQISAEQLQRPIATIFQQAHRLDRLTTMLLDLTRLEHGKLRLNHNIIDLSAIIAEIADGLQLLAERHELKLTIPQSPLLIEGDELRIEQIFYNLFQNAIKYSPAGGTITIIAGRVGQDAIITITDQGIGIPAADLPHIFERFYRSTGNNSESISGMGIGLYIVKELVMLHGGIIGVESTTGQGSTFTVQLPLLEGVVG